LRFPVPCLDQFHGVGVCPPVDEARLVLGDSIVSTVAEKIEYAFVSADLAPVGVVSIGNEHH
jgi:hypothetical protein